MHASAIDDTRRARYPTGACPSRAHPVQTRRCKQRLGELRRSVCYPIEPTRFLGAPVLRAADSSGAGELGAELAQGTGARARMMSAPGSACVCACARVGMRVRPMRRALSRVVLCAATCMLRPHSVPRARD